MKSIQHVKKRALLYTLLLSLSVIIFAVSCVSNPLKKETDIAFTEQDDQTPLIEGKNWAAAEEEPITHQEIDYSTFIQNYLAGQLFEYEGNLEDAAIHYSAASKAYPSQELLREKAFSFALLSGNWDDSITFAQDIATQDTSLMLVHMATIAEQIRQKKWAKAQKNFHTYLPPMPKVIHFQLIENYLTLAQDTTNYLDVTETIRNLPYNSAMSPIKHYHLGRIFEIYGNLDEAELEYTMAYEQDSKSILITERLVRLLKQKGKSHKAQEIIASYAQHSPESVSLLHTQKRLIAQDAPKTPEITKEHNIQKAISEIIFNFATLLSAQNADLSSQQMINIALAIDPQNNEAAFYKGLLYEEMGNTEKALNWYKRIPKSTNTYAPAQLRIAGIYQENESFEAAVKTIQNLITLYSKPLFDRILAELYLDAENYNQAIAVYNTVIGNQQHENTDATIARAYFARGSAYERLKQYDAAKADLEASIEIDPKNPITLNYLGYLLVDHEHDLKRGLSLIEKALQIRPEDPAILDSMGWALYKIGNFKQALSFLEKAILFRPEDPTINMHLGDTYLRIGQKEKATNHYQKALDMGPESTQDNIYIQKKLKDLRKK